MICAIWLFDGSLYMERYEMKRKIINLFYKILRVYWRIFKPITLGVRAVVVNDKNEILLVKHTYQNNWFLPGGGVDKGETFYQSPANHIGRLRKNYPQIAPTGYRRSSYEI